MSACVVREFICKGEMSVILRTILKVRVGGSGAVSLGWFDFLCMCYAILII